MQRSRCSAALFLGLCLVGLAPVVLAQPPEGLQAPSAFASIENLAVRSAALFTEAGKVFQSPRCQNCHPADRLPTQGEELHTHDPFMQGGSAGHGVPGLPCATCHTERNVATLGWAIESVPGAPHWGLAPQSMGWQGLSIGEICEQIKDTGRNGGRNLQQIHQHLMTDPLVAWGWTPGPGRVPAPGTQADFAVLVAAWIETGAHCPSASDQGF